MEDTQRPFARRATMLFLATVWCATTGATLWFAAQTTGAVPKFDEWPLMVPALSGVEAVDMRWFWSQLNEHRIPIPRLAYLAAFYVSGGDFRSGAFLSVALLSLTALAGMLLARRRRGASSIADAFFPLILLHWGQAQTLLLGVLLNFTVTIAFFYAALYVAIASPGPLSIRRGAVLAGCALGMIGSSLAGAVLAVPLLFWMGMMAVRRLTVREHLHGLAVLVMIAIPVITMGLYFVGWHRPPAPGFAVSPPGNPALIRLKNAAFIFAMSLGWLGRASWPAAIALLAFAGAVWTALVVKVLRTNFAERERASAVFAIGGSLVLLILALSCGRAFFWGEALWSTTRYATLSIPLLVVLYLTVLLYFSSIPRTVSQGVLCGIAGVVFLGHCLGIVHYPYDLSFARWLRSHEERLVRGLFTARPAEDVAHDFFASENNYSARDGTHWLHMLRSSNLGPFSLSSHQRAALFGGWDPLALNRAPLRLETPGAETFLGAGWSPSPDPGGRWTVGPLATVHLPDKRRTARSMTIQMMGFLVPGKVDRQRVGIVVNGKEIGCLEIKQPGWQEYTIDLEGARLPHDMTLRLPDAITPSAVGYNADDRAIGVCVHALWFD
jgi:hypothetical protein